MQNPKSPNQIEIPQNLMLKGIKTNQNPKPRDQNINKSTNNCKKVYKQERDIYTPFLACSVHGGI